ncbi:MAG TPA: 50S ribosomal protein L21 [Acidobacteriota bacterium]
MYAVIRAGGKQLKVSEGSIVEVERQNVNPGDSIKFPEVLMIAGEGNLNVGTPLIENANVFGTVLDIHRSPKVLVFKKKRRKQYRRTRGHRQYLIRVRIDELGLYEERRKKPLEIEPVKVAQPVEPEAQGTPEEPKRVAAKREAPPKKGTKVAAKAEARKASPKEKASARKKEAPKKAGKLKDTKKKKK